MLRSKLKSGIGFLIIPLGFAVLAGGCGGKLATQNCAMVSNICPNGLMLLSYSDGKSEWKRLQSDNVRKDSREVAKNLFKPARVVETEKGSAITFPCGDTFIYRNLPKPCE